MAALSSTLLIGSAVVSAGASVAQGVAQRRAARALEREGGRLAADALERGEEDVERYQRNLSQILGAQRATIAAANLDPETGTAAILREQTQEFGEEDIATIRLNAMREARGLRANARIGAQDLRAQSIGAFGRAGSTLLTAGADAWEIYNRRRGSASSQPQVGDARWRQITSNNQRIIDDALRGYP